MPQHHKPDSARDRRDPFGPQLCRGCLQAFRRVGKEIFWEGEGVDELGRERRNNQALIQIDKRCFGPIGVDLLIGDASKAAIKLDWKPTTTFDELAS
ncbi:GDP-mannose 4,6-dehydratase [Mesorhizobium sp.]|uniref:GDP-mannose 4,6-dehydratase n=1 Tax=Mesorhizobium sp. TaxID=1871066 RepID=UPI000FE3E70B|nr:MAG: hypothetical protein EOS06_33210 [Mesorhizobium sp.]RWO75973.1 MAG: hypothetical protein EOS18_27300 [Mesorhizobium sp.]TIN34595.1 MAG: hypothetical protein E5Y13_28515 [Mesorhizobium sp.]TIN74976.1 MAG: hypothetical protein E5Y09_30070 [Mesorhizobium sp.]TIO64324.1 MAG: hypothetical protein E5X85_33780 [Mesorhizobium sp.]